MTLSIDGVGDHVSPHVPLPFRRSFGILNPNFGITILNSLNVVKVSLTEVKDGAVRCRAPRNIQQTENKNAVRTQDL